ncbi:MAG: hypothetical protein ABGW77_00410 [Campylobacterales bacterium]
MEKLLKIKLHREIKIGMDLGLKSYPITNDGREVPLPKRPQKTETLIKRELLRKQGSEKQEKTRERLAKL